MARQNRVMPWGEIVADPGRGLFMGNRGCLHDDQRRLRRVWQGKGWISCVLDFKARKRALMQPGRYTKLFFLDEAVALAAGHRPCAECRRADYNRFRAAWAAAGLAGASAAEMDQVLHAARTAVPQLYASAATLPEAAFVREDGEASLLLGGALRGFTPEGYGRARALPEREVEVLTPAPMIAVLRAGYRPVIHPSAG